MPRYWQLFALLALAFPIASHAQSLGDVAREIRAEKQKSEHSPKVITNDDLARSAPPIEPDLPTGVTAQRELVNGSTKTQAVADTDETSRDSAKSATGTLAEHPEEASNVDRESQERESQRRTEIVNQSYRDRITALSEQFNTAQEDLRMLQGSYEYPNELDRYPEGDWGFREQQRLDFNRHVTEMIESQTKLVGNLKSQLEDLKEEARHAGVPHATD